MSNNAGIRMVGTGCSGIFWAGLSLMFIGLKITGNIDWSWLWVLSPLWGIPALVVVVFIGIFSAALALGTISKLFFWSSKVISRMGKHE